MFKRFFRSLINATEPTIEAALPRPATAERNARGGKTRKRYIEIAAALKAEAGITQHTATVSRDQRRADYCIGYDLIYVAIWFDKQATHERSN